MVIGMADNTKEPPRGPDGVDEGVFHSLADESPHYRDVEGFFQCWTIIFGGTRNEPEVGDNTQPQKGR